MPESKFVRFALIGVIAFFVDVFILQLVYLWGIGLYFGRLISFTGAATFTWYLNRKLTFKSNDPRLFRQWFQFLSANSIGGLVNYSVYALFVHQFSGSFLHAIIGVAAGSIAGLSVNFILSNRLVFQ